MTPEKKRWFVFGGVSALLAIGLGTLLYFQHEGIERRRLEVAALREKIEQDKKLLEKDLAVTQNQEPASGIAAARAA